MLTASRFIPAIFVPTLRNEQTLSVAYPACGAVDLEMFTDKGVHRSPVRIGGDGGDKGLLAFTNLPTGKLMGAVVEYAIRIQTIKVCEVAEIKTKIKERLILE